ncbi:hypothetical protein PMKS-002205 [Pichia membranifaciens]|uniref:SRP9 domain-containing protein n=1 Tax=Pichia membranifaciens TaxID=4926 RepID=A0A1Q2YGN4_9ASCO|nr:hypothetical protein PMKS-002205 [Pichia membranifaciens]
MKIKQIDTKDDDKIRSIIRFKTYDPKSGICHVFKTHKVKEFSKLFNALGPRGCNVDGQDVEGLSLLFSNTDKDSIIKEVSEPVPSNEKIKAEAEASPEPSQKKKKNKKKGKK